VSKVRPELCDWLREFDKTNAEVIAMFFDTDMMRKIESLVIVFFDVEYRPDSFILRVPLLNVYTLPCVEACAYTTM
jgi:hypothetical protein